MKYTVLVKPGSKIEKITEENGILTVFIHERAHDGEANKAVIESLAKYLRRPKTQIQILSGAKGRRKVIEIK